MHTIAIAGYYDEVRLRFSRCAFDGLQPDDVLRIVTAHSCVTYLAEVFHRDEVETCAWILRIGSASSEIGRALFQDGR